MPSNVHLNDPVDAMATCHSRDALGNILGFVIDDFVNTHGLHVGGFCRRADRGDDFRSAHFLGHLNGVVADRSRAAGNQNDFAGDAAIGGQCSVAPSIQEYQDKLLART